MALVVGVAQAPVRAQVNALQQLSREIIGSSFDSDFSSPLAGTNSVVDGSAINSGSVMTNLVDSEIRRRPSSIAQSAPSSTGKKTVQLLVPVISGLEFKNIQALIPNVKILEMSRRVFVLVAETARALPAYNLGRKLQDQLDVVFELAYSDNHPDLNLAWLSKINGDIASTPKINGQEVNKTHANVAHQSNLEPVLNNSIKKVDSTNNPDDLGVLAWSFSSGSESPSLNSSISESKSTKINLTLSSDINPEVDSSVVKSESLISESKVSKSLDEIAPLEGSYVKTKFKDSLADVLAELKSMRRTKSESLITSSEVPAQVASIPNDSATMKSSEIQKHSSNIVLNITESSDIISTRDDSSLSQNNSFSSIDNILADLRSMRSSVASSIVPNSQSSISKPGLSRTLVNAVGIKPVEIAGIPVVSSRYMAANKDLAYVYVKVSNKAQIASLKNLSSSPVVIIIGVRCWQEWEFTGILELVSGCKKVNSNSLRKMASTLG